MKLFQVPAARVKAVLSSTALIVLVGIVVSSLAACGAGRKIISKVTSVGDGKLYAVGVEKAPFYRYGPQQASGPDEQLPKDTLVKLIRHSFGYSKVIVAETGQLGFVASEDLTVASAAMIAAATATPPPQVTASSGPAREQFDVESADPSFVPPPEGLPAPDLPPPLPESSPL